MVVTETALFWNRTIKRRTAKWLYGLIGGFVGTFAGTLESTVVLMIAVPETFNIHAMGKTLGLSVVIGALQGLKVACAYLAKSPLPGPTGDTDRLDDTTKREGHLR